MSTDINLRENLILTRKRADSTDEIVSENLTDLQIWFDDIT